MTVKPRTVGYGAGGIRASTEVEWARNRPDAHRPPMCQVGDRVLYRSNEFMDLVEAIVVAIVEDREDPNVYHRDGSTLRPDPWPEIQLRIDPGTVPETWDKRRRALARLTIQCREARLDGAAGWLPTNWAMWPRPVHDRHGSR